jgi:3-oxoacyl-[acyl-carrier-protein] synthase I
MKSIFPSGAVAVSGVGVCTPLGHTSRSSYAAFRAGLMSVAETDIVGREGEPLRASYLKTISLTRTRIGRMLDLTALALNDLIGSVQIEANKRIALFLGLPDSIKDSEQEHEEFGEALIPIVRAHIPTFLPRPQFFCNGRSAFFFALEEGLSVLASGTCDVAIVGAVDSMCSKDVLAKLDRERRLLGPSIFDGMIPGEGAALAILERADDIRSTQNQVHAVVSCAVTDVESRHFQQELPNKAEALSKVLRVLFKHPMGHGKRADLLFTCETGERFWTDELSMAYLRNVTLMPEPFVRTMAAETLGDVGAAAGAVLFGLGVHALSRRGRLGGTNTPTLLICGTSDDGHLGACLVQGHVSDQDQRG